MLLPGCILQVIFLSWYTHSHQNFVQCHRSFKNRGTGNKQGKGHRPGLFHFLLRPYPYTLTCPTQQGPVLYPRLALNSLCNPGWIQTHTTTSYLNLYALCRSWGFCCCDKLLTERNLRRKCLFGLHFCIIVHHEGTQGRSSRQELKQNPWRNAPYQLVAPGLLSLLSYSILCPLGVAPPTVSWTRSHPASLEKMPHRLAYRPFWWREAFSYLRFSVPKQL